MIEQLLFYVHYALLLIFGVLITFSLSQISFSRKNLLNALIYCVFSGTVQIVFLLIDSEALVRQLYPLIVHLPLVLLLCFLYQKSLRISIAAVTSAYLFCQPADWFGIMAHSLSGSSIVNFSVRIVLLISAGAIVLSFFSSLLAEIFAKGDNISFYFTSIPIVYYLYDYTFGSLISYWNPYSQAIVEFLPFFICILFLIFSSVYYREYESKILSERKEQIIQIALEQQAKESELIEISSQRIRLLRHDMRLLLNNIALSIQNNDSNHALQLISSYISEIDSTAIIRYCKDDTVNYVLTYYAGKCKELNIQFETDINLATFPYDSLLFSSILSNGLDNAFNAQKELDADKRCVKVMLKQSNHKILLSIKNPTQTLPVFADGIPVSVESGHGYGTQSIRYLTERLGGNCQFSVQDGWFTLRVVI